MLPVENQPGAAQEDVNRLLCLIFGNVQAQAIGVAAELGIADLLADGPKSLEQLAQATNTQTAALLRVLRLLEHLDIVAESGAGAFRSTPLGSLLQSGALCDYARLTNSATVVQVAGRMLEALQSGDSQYAALFGTGFYESLQGRPADAAMFHGAMKEISRQDILALRGGYDFSACRVLVDVGGGQGHLLAALLNANPQLQGVLLDLPDVVEDAHAVLAGHIAGGRCRIVAGDFLKEVPGGGDIYLLKRVLSHCSADQARRLLANVRAGMAAGGRLLIADPDPESLYGASFDVLMLVLLGGGLRNEARLRDLFGETGFAYHKALKIGGEVHLVEALAA